MQDQLKAETNMNTQDSDKGLELLAGRPETHCIIARLQQDECESQSDYFASRTIKTVVLALSTHGKDLFSEMRKAATLYPDTAHLGPGKGQFTPLVVLTSDVRANGSCYWKGCGSHWHTDLYGGFGAPKFETRAEAEAFIAAAGEPRPINFEGTLATFSWEIREESVEHREKYSMGSGYFLQAGSKYSGWRVSKSRINGAALAAIGRGDHTLAFVKATPARRAPQLTLLPFPTPLAPILAEFAAACYIG
jgi:hypothetical protein